MLSSKRSRNQRGTGQHGNILDILTASLRLLRRVFTIVAKVSVGQTVRGLEHWLERLALVPPIYRELLNPTRGTAAHLVSFLKNFEMPTMRNQAHICR